MEPLGPEFLRRLERLAVAARQTVSGVGRGDRRSKRHGGTVEFADYRGYSPGDDTRQIDWYAYARFEQLFLKLYVEEQDLTLTVLVDHSASMGAGTPPKLPFANQLALAFAYIGLAAGDRVLLRAYRGGESAPELGPLRGRHALVRFWRHLHESAASGVSSTADAVRRFLAHRRRPGVVLVISDLLERGDVTGPLAQLRAAGHEVHALHVVAPDEVAPEVGQDLELVDAETGDVVSVAMTQGAVRAYREAFAARLADLERNLARHEIGYVAASSDVPFEEVVLGAARERGLIR